jgi:cell division inhibitor SepF
MGFFSKISEYAGFSGNAEATATPSAGASKPSRVTQLKPRRVAGEVTEIHTVEATSYQDSREVAINYRAGTPVIVNMGAMSEAESRRLVDFMLGLRWGLEGHLRRVTPKVWLLTPTNVDINGEDETGLAEDDDQVVAP